MKIIHIGMASFFTEGMTYQENQLVHQNAIDGNDVLFVSNAQKYQNGDIVDTGFEDVRLEDGSRLIRLPYVSCFGKYAASKIRKVKGLYRILEDFSPDVILSHDLSYLSVLDVVKYRKKHPTVKFYADTHTADYNSGTNWVSLHILHRVFYRLLNKKAIPFIEKYLYVGESEKQFSIENYGVPESIMEYYPLGGVLYSDIDYGTIRARKREELNIKDNQRLYIHSGKLVKSKRTVELLRAYSSVKDVNSKMLIIGSIPDELSEEIKQLIELDERISFLGWKSGDDLQQYLCACDMYCQPGSVSATLQNAICKGCAIMVYPHAAYTGKLNFGQFIYVKTKEDMIDCFNRIANEELDINVLKANAFKCGKELLDYKILADRITIDA